MSLLGLIRKSRTAGETVTTEENTEMSLEKVTIEELQKANPALYESIVAKALESVKDKDGKRVGSVDVQQSVDEKDGSRVAGVKLAGVTDAAVDEKKDTVSSPKDDSQAGMNGGVAKAIADLQKGMGELATTLKSMCEKVEKLDTSRPGEAAAEKEEKAAVKATQNAVDTTGDSNGGVAKIDTSRPGEAAIESKEKAAVKANAAAVDASAKAGDSGIGAVETGDCCKEANAALKDEVATLKEQVSQLTKAMQPRLENVEKAMGKMIREKLAKTEEVQKSVEEPVVKARSQQAGQFDESGAKDAVRVKKTVFDSAISTVALAKAGQEAR